MYLIRKVYVNLLETYGEKLIMYLIIICLKAYHRKTIKHYNLMIGRNCKSLGSEFLDTLPHNYIIVN